MKILILYQSRNGHTRDASENIARVAREFDHDVKLKSVIEVKKLDIDQADMLFVGTWVQGMILFGVKPAGAELWVPALPSLAGKPTGIFCTYAFNPRGSLNRLEALLTARGAHVVGKHAFHRTRIEGEVKPFVEQVLQMAMHERA